jgi:hypothetical protein
MARTSAKIGPQKTVRKKDKIPLDSGSAKKRRGRPVKIQPTWVRGRADNYRRVFDQLWEHIWPGLSKAETREDVVRSFSAVEVGGYAADLVILADLILQVVHDPKFPKRQRQAQINFLADSIAAHGTVTPRRSRDICERERARIKRAHRILCYEYYIECSCGYKGHSRNHACPDCEAVIPFPSNSLFDVRF